MTVGVALFSAACCLAGQALVLWLTRTPKKDKRRLKVVK